MTWLQERLARLEPPPVRAGFREQLWERIEQRERTAARRWRAAAMVAIASSVAAASAAGVFAFGRGGSGTVDKTISCPVPVVGGVNKLSFYARTNGNPTHVGGKTEPNPGALGVVVGAYYPAAQLAGISSGKSGYVVDHSECTSAAAITLARAGLPSIGVFTAKGTGTTRECWIGSVATIRLHVIFGASGVPVGAELAVRSGQRRRPVAFVEWTPKRVSAFASASCHAATR